MGATEPWETARETRDNIEFYLEDLPAFLKQKDENIERYLDDKDNESKIAKYENYARVRILHGETQEYYVPKDFR